MENNHTLAENEESTRKRTRDESDRPDAMSISETTNTEEVSPLHGRNAVHLARRNKLKLDSEIEFVEETHKYYVFGKLVERSTTALVHAGFADFDAVETVNKYYDAWKRKGLRTGDHKYWNIIQLTTTEGGNVLTDEEAKKEIAESWTRKGQEASELGTKFHLYCELLWNQPHVDTLDDLIYASPFETPLRIPSDQLYAQFGDVRREIAQYHEFLKSKWSRELGLVVYRSELSVHYTKNGITACAGQIDALCYSQTTNRYIMIDYKRIKAEKRLHPDEPAFDNKRGKGFLSHVPDTDYYHHCLQQAIYMVMLKRCTGIEVDAAYLLRVHADLKDNPDTGRPAYNLVECKPMHNEAEQVLEQEYWRLSHASHADASDDDAPYHL